MKKTLLFVFMVFVVTKTFSQWQGIDLPKGIQVNTFYISNDKLFAGTTNGTYQLVSDKWTKLSGDINYSIKCLLEYNNYLYAGTANSGVYRSSNGGESWLLVNNNLTPTAIQDLKLYKNYIVAGTSNGLYTSDNNGVQWTDKSANIGNKNIKSILSFADSLFVGTQSGVYMTADTGKTWKARNTGLGTKNISSIIAVGSRLFVSVANGGVYMSTDTAKNWTIQNQNLSNLNVNLLYYFSDTLFAGTTDSLYIATHLPNISWKAFPMEQPSEAVNAIAGYNNKLIVGNSFGVSYREGNTIATLNGGFPEWNIDRLFPIDTLLISSTNKGVWDYDCINHGWKYDSRFPGNALTGLTQFNDTTQLMFNNTGLYVSVDTLKTWKKINTKTNISSLAVWDTIIFAGTSTEGIYRSNDTGKNWLPVNIGLSQLTVKNLLTNGDYVYAYCGSGKYFYSNNKGDEWIAINSCYAYDLNDMLSFQNKIFCVQQINHSTIGSGTNLYWNHDNLDNFVVNDSNFIDYHNGHNSFMKLKAIGNTLFAGSEYAGMYMSADAGKNWSQINKGLSYYKAPWTGTYERTYPKILQLVSGNDSTLYFVNDSNQLYYRKMNDIKIPAAPTNFRVQIDTSHYNNYNLAFRWETNAADNVTEYFLLYGDIVVAIRTAASDTLQLNNLGWWDKNYKNNVKTYRLVSLADGDYSLPSNYCNIVNYILGIDNSITENFSIYPNPVSDYLYIKTEKAGLNGKASIFNSAGVKVAEQRLTGSLSVVNIAGCSPGVYFIEVADGNNKVQRTKIIKK